MGPLFNGILKEKVEFGYGLMLSNWEAWYPVLSGEVIELDQIKMYDWEGVFTDKPTTIFVVDDKWQRTQIARFTGPRYDLWTGPYPDSPNQYNLNNLVSNFKYIVVNTYGNMPSEIEFYGNYQVPPVALSNPVFNNYSALKNMTGANGFEWNFLNSDGFGISQKSLQMAKAFNGFRHYLDWQKLEKSEGAYTYNPCYSGSWNLETLYRSLKQANIEVLACIKNIPDWIESTYPADKQGMENVPLKYGRDYILPTSYIEQAKLAFQYAARYGSNKNVNPSLLSVYQIPRWTGDSTNIVKIGLDLVKYIECNNETDKWWKGREAYQMGREYAANLSAFYDGHMNTMGVGVGAKNADPNIKIVMAGTASTNTDYVRGMIDWCAQYRGYLANGAINFCWDIINYHFYSNDALFSQYGGNASVGVAPEFGSFEKTAQNFIKMAAVIAKNMPVWVTETGYDINPSQSSQYAPAIGSKSVLETQADWILRTSLLSARNGIGKLFFYEMYDDNPYGGQFGTCGLLSSKDSARRPAANFLNQLNQQFGNYIYQENIHHNPEVDRYEFNKQSMYVVWNPTQTGSVLSYSLDLGKMDSATIYSPNAYADTMKATLIRNTMSALSLTVTEIPQFIIPHLHLIDLEAFSVKTVDGHKVGMSWQVSADSTVQEFSIERMNESSKIFASIGKVKPNDLRSLSPLYHFTDTLANNGFNHYRLKTTVSTLSFFYSKIDQAFVGSLISYPNPFSESINLQGLAAGKTTTLKIFTIDGRLVKTATVNANSYQWFLGDLSNGIYSLISDDGVSQQRIRINKLPKH